MVFSDGEAARKRTGDEHGDGSRILRNPNNCAVSVSQSVPRVPRCGGLSLFHPTPVETKYPVLGLVPCSDRVFLSGGRGLVQSVRGLVCRELRPSTLCTHDLLQVASWIWIGEPMERRGSIPVVPTQRSAVWGFLL